LDKAFLERCLADGMSLPEIGRIVGRPPGTVGYWVKRHGLVANGATKFRPGRGISRAALEPLVNEGLTLGQIAAKFEVSIKTVHYWVRNHGLPRPVDVRARDTKERLRSGDTRAMRKCRHHGYVEFTLDRRGSWRCRQCRQDAVAERRRKVKRILVEEAGGECRLCGYDKAIGALQFHHLDPATKHFGLAQRGHTVGIALARAEAAKCVLLCANCHVEIETGVTTLPPIPMPLF
jgi:hypothetical protein